jgi:hypothetical protein
MLFAEAAAIGGVHLEKVDRCTANRCASENEDCVALEVLIPLVLPGMKQSNKCAAFGVKRAEIWPLMRVAVVTGESEVFTVVGAAVLASDDVLDAIGEKGSAACDIGIIRSLPSRSRLARALQRGGLKAQSELLWSRRCTA